MQPSWMMTASMPSDAVEQWRMLARPEGLRCLVIAVNGRTMSRKKNGTLLHKFESTLPHGAGGVHAIASGSKQKAACATILDCVWNDAAKTYFVLDVCAWNGIDALGPAEWRQIWLREKFTDLMTKAAASATTTECGAGVLSLPSAKSQSSPSYAFHLLPWLACTSRTFEAHYPRDPILAALGGDAVQQDGFLFMHRQTQYEFGKTELQMQWKDAACSRYFIDSTATNGSGSCSKQLVTLLLGPQRQLLCADGEVAGILDEYTYQTGNLKEGSLLQFEMDGIDETEETPSSSTDASSSTAGGDDAASAVLRPLKLLGLSFLKRGSAARLVPDARDKIVYQHHARTGQLLTARTIYEQLQKQETEMQQRQVETGPQLLLQQHSQPQQHLQSHSHPQQPIPAVVNPAAANATDMDI